MKNSRIIAIILFTSLTLIYSCSMDCIDGNGDTTTVRRVVGDFNKVASYGDFIVDVSIGPITSVSVEADENLLSYIKTYIQGNTLVLETDDNHCLKSRDQIYIHVETPSVYELKLAGSGVIYCDNVTADELKYVLSGSGEIQSTGIITDFIDASLSGSGEITLSGTCSQSAFIVSGSGNIKAINLEQDKSIVTISGSGNIYVYANDELDVQVSGSGNVIYRGNPSIVKKITGSGRVIRY